jgi:hypothetical protein
MVQEFETVASVLGVIHFHHFIVVEKYTVLSIGFKTHMIILIGLTP